MIKKHNILFLFLFVILLLVGCSSKENLPEEILPEEILPTNLILDSSTITLNKGESKKINYTLEPSNSTENLIIWETNNSSIATVYNGEITGISNGSTIVTASTKNGIKASITVIVKDTVTYISDRSLEKVTDSNLYRFFFSFLNNKEVSISSPATVDIRIVNSDNSVVYSKKHNVTKNNFSDWTWTVFGQKTTKYLCSIDIPFSAITKGNSNTGKLYYKIVAEGNLSFDEYSLDINDLPINFEVKLPSTPLVISNTLSSGSKMYSVSITEIKYEYKSSYDGSITLTVLFSGKKTYDWDGSNSSSTMSFSYKLYDKDGYVVESGSFYTPSLKTGEKFRNVESKTYDLSPGEYEIVIIAYQS